MKDHFHVSGVGGVGMNAIAQLLVADGKRVTGSDRFLDQGVELPVFGMLRKLGVELVPQDGAVLDSQTKGLVLSTAVEADNPERLAAKEKSVPEKHRAEVLAEFTRKGSLAAIAGTSGKTSCAGWLGWTLAACGLDPNVVNGGGILGWKSEESPGNVRCSSPEKWWVVEVDESDRSLLKFNPEIALINTLTADHHSLEDSIDLFRAFAKRVKKTIVCGPGVKPYLEDFPGIQAELIEVTTPLQASLPGTHNHWNAAAVFMMAKASGCDPLLAEQAIKTFRGVERRLEGCNPESRGPLIFDDYAHNPEKISAAIQAVRPENGRLFILWRPHGFAPLKQNFQAFVEAFTGNLREEDEAWILPVFYAGGTAPDGTDSNDFVRALTLRGVNAQVLEDYPPEVPLDSRDVLLVTGARDPELPVFAQRMGRLYR